MTDDRIIRTIPAKNGYKPDVSIFERDGRQIVAKDFTRKTWWVRRIWGPLNLSYEQFMLRRLAGLEGIPQVIRRESRARLLISYIPGTVIRAVKHSLDTGYYDRLMELARSMHRRGVLHMDLGHKDNVMAMPDGKPAIIDFNSALFIPPVFGLKWLIRLIGKVDLCSVLRLKVNFLPDAVSEPERRSAERYVRLKRWWIFSKLLKVITGSKRRAARRKQARQADASSNSPTEQPPPGQ